MTGQQAFDQMVTATTTTRVRLQNHITQAEFEQWQLAFTFEALQGQRYGQSFCNHFGISDNLLYYTQWPTDQVDDYIQRYYLAGP